jgi:hypothetical protein
MGVGCFAAGAGPGGGGGATAHAQELQVEQVEEEMMKILEMMSYKLYNYIVRNKLKLIKS